MAALGNTSNLHITKFFDTKGLWNNLEMLLFFSHWSKKTFNLGWGAGGYVFCSVADIVWKKGGSPILLSLGLMFLRPPCFLSCREADRSLAVSFSVVIQLEGKFKQWHSVAAGCKQTLLIGSELSTCLPWAPDKWTQGCGTSLLENEYYFLFIRAPPIQTSLFQWNFSRGLSFWSIIESVLFVNNLILLFTFALSPICLLL